MNYDLLIKNGSCVLPSGIKIADIAIKDGKIVDFGELDAKKADKVIDAKNLHILPGMIDSQVHFREPGLEHKEDLFHGTKAAVMGGITSIFEMPNTNPPTTSVEALQYKLNSAGKNAWCNYAFYMGGTPDPEIDWHKLEMLEGCAGIKIFMGSSTGSLLVKDDEYLRNILKQATRRVAIHAEDENRLKERFHIAENGKDPKFHPIWRDEETAFLATKRIVTIAKELGKQIHVLHITSKKELDFLSQHKDVATVECLPQHLTFTSDDYYRLGTRLQMNPPIREKIHQDALWHAIDVGVVDVLGSDHAPHTLEEKAKEYPASPSGMPGVQTILPVMLNHVNEGRLTLTRLVDLMAISPARVFQMVTKGRLVAGYDADITIVDMQKKYVVEDKDMKTKCGWTPFHGMKLQGKPVYTIIHGNIVMNNDELIGEPLGKPVQFIPTLKAL